MKENIAISYPYEIKQIPKVAKILYGRIGGYWDDSGYVCVHRLTLNALKIAAKIWKNIVCL